MEILKATCVRTLSRLAAGFFWHLLHLLLGVFLALCRLIRMLEFWAISIGLVWKYQNLDLGRLNYLAVAVNGDETRSLDKINQILRWLSALGVKNVILYDREGVLEKCFDSDTMRFRDSNAVGPLPVQKDKPRYLHHEKMAIEFLSSSNGKEGVAKAASFLCSKHLSGGDSSAEPVFTEADMTSALMAVGSGGPDPNLLLVYGPVRCHLGFPSWRLRYTEIIHMGDLKSSTYGALVKALYKFSKKHQNYGS